MLKELRRLKHRTQKSAKAAEQSSDAELASRAVGVVIFNSAKWFELIWDSDTIAVCVLHV